MSWNRILICLTFHGNHVLPSNFGILLTRCVAYIATMLQGGHAWHASILVFRWTNTTPWPEEWICMLLDAYFVSFFWFKKKSNLLWEIQLFWGLVIFPAQLPKVSTVLNADVPATVRDYVGSTWEGQWRVDGQQEIVESRKLWGLIVKRLREIESTVNIKT